MADLRRPEYRTASFRVAAFYSKSRSFLKLVPASGRFSCDEEAAAKVQYLIQGEELQGQERLDCFYLVSLCRLLRFWWVLPCPTAPVKPTVSFPRVAR